MSHGVLILSGYNIRAIVAFCRWATKSLVPFHLIARDEFDPIFLTSFRDNVFLIREYKSLGLEDFCSWIERLREQYLYQEVLLLPSSEFLNRFMIHNRPRINLSGGVVPLVNEELYERVSDKYSFGESCSSVGITVPEEYLEPPKDFPYVIKPRNYSSINNRQLKPHLIYSANDLDNFLRNETADDFYYQQYVEGHSIYLLASIPKSGDPVLFSQENLMQQANGGSIILARTSDFHKQQMALPYVELLTRIKFYGLIMIEVRFQRDLQKCFMIEANPRLWGPSQLFVDNGVDIFGSFLSDYGFDVNHFHDENKNSQFYFWSGGLLGKEKPVYHNYSSDEFVEGFSSVACGDIFSREDTLDLYHYEIRKHC